MAIALQLALRASDRVSNQQFADQVTTTEGFIYIDTIVCTAAQDYCTQHRPQLQEIADAEGAAQLQSIKTRLPNRSTKKCC